MLRKFIQNCCQPNGKFGYFVLKSMNIGHSPITSWAFKFLPFYNGQKLIDIGCGGGANIARLLKIYTSSIIDGVDYSQQSVIVSKKINSKLLNKRCNIYQANVKLLPFSNETYDGAIAVETIYFWPDITLCFKEVNRILKKGCYFMVICEMSDPEKGKKWSSYCEKMTIYTPEEIKQSLMEAGFFDININTKGIWSAIIAKKN